MTLVVLFALLGLAVGSFLNVCCDRLPVRQSIVSPASHCDSCGRRLAAGDLVPVLSYIWLRGHCRQCNARIPLRQPVVELVTAALFGLLAWRYGLSLQLGMAAVYSCVFVIVFVTDIEHGLILDVVTYPAMGLAFLFSFLWPHTGWPAIGALSALLGGAVGFALLLMPYLLSREGMGGGDVKLAALIGLATGFPLVVLALAMAILAAGLLAIVLLLSRRKTRKQTVPFGPFLAAGAMLTLVYGGEMSAWLLSLV